MKMPQEVIEKSMFAPCGMNCAVCYKHCYSKQSCSGCLQSDKKKPKHCHKCEIRNCVKEKKTAYCYECEEYPCKDFSIKTI